MAATTNTLGVHLVGGLPFETGMDAYRWIDRELKPWIRRVPDETGARSMWAMLQMRFFAENPAFETVQPGPDAPFPIPASRLKEGVDPADVEFAPFTYGDEARAAFASFKQAHSEGLLAPGTKFQFGMPSPLTTVGLFVAAESQIAVLPAYERRTREALEDVLGSLPHDELVIQWDIPIEVVSWENSWYPNVFGDTGPIAELLARIGNWVPEDVDLGYHLCFGDSTQFPRPRPADATVLAEVLDAIATIGRRIDFVHLPIPIEWTEPAAFAPLADIALGVDTEMYLGVVHHEDGTEAARRRFDAAAAVLDRPLGVATECGMGRGAYRSESGAEFRACVGALRALADPEAAAV